MRLDTLRILGLMICTDQSKLLIQLETPKSSAEISNKVMQNLVLLATIFSHLAIDDKHRNMYLEHVNY